MTKKTFEDRFEETAKKASAAIERPPDEMKPLARKTATEFVQELFTDIFVWVIAALKLN